MEKIKNTLKSVNKFGLLALVFVAFATLAFKAPSKQTDVKYRLVGAEWLEVSGTQNYVCNGETEICTRTYPATQNPNEDDSNPTGEENGIFMPLP